MHKLHFLYLTRAIFFVSCGLCLDSRLRKKNITKTSREATIISTISGNLIYFIADSIWSNKKLRISLLFQFFHSQSVTGTYLKEPICFSRLIILAPFLTEKYWVQKKWNIEEMQSVGHWKYQYKPATLTLAKIYLTKAN